MNNITVKGIGMTQALTLITGASGGMATALGLLLHQQGHALVLVSRHPENIHLDLQANHTVIQTDVSRPGAADELLVQCADKLGRVPDNLAHLAGSILLTPIHRTRDADYQMALNANLHSTFYTVRAFISALLAYKQPGNIALVSSVAAQIGIANHEVIAMAKGAVEGLVRSVAATYSAKGIRINAIAPGLMRSPANEGLFVNASAEKNITSQYPLGRYGQSEDGAQALAWLLSTQAGWITGQILSVDGGFTAVRPFVKG